MQGNKKEKGFLKIIGITMLSVSLLGGISIFSFNFYFDFGSVNTYNESSYDFNGDAMLSPASENANVQSNQNSYNMSEYDVHSVESDYNSSMIVKCNIHTFNERGFCLVCGTEFPMDVVLINYTTRHISNYNVPIRARPYAPDEILERLPKGYVVTVNGRGENSVSNVWYRLSNGNWIFSENLCDSHNFNEYGFCVECDAEFFIILMPMNNEIFSVINDSAPVRARPYAPDEILKRLPFGTEVTVSGRGVNARGNPWYQLTDGNWIYRGNIEPVN